MLTNIVLDDNLVKEAIKLSRVKTKKGITIRSTIDCIVAQTTIEHDLYLLHHDKDFEIMGKVIPLKFY